MPYRDHPNNILGVDTADNLFDSSLVTANRDGSMIERQEFIISTVISVGNEGLSSVGAGSVD